MSDLSGDLATKNKIEALRIAIHHIEKKRCPLGEWPSVTILKRMKKELEVSIDGL